MRYFWFLALLPPLFAIPLPATSQTSPFTSASIVGMGGAGRTLAVDNGGIELNPATLSLSPRYTIEFDYHLFSPLSSNNYTLSIMDSRTLPLALGLLWTYHSFEQGLDPEERPPWREPDADNTLESHTHNAFSIALSYPFLNRNLTFGTNVKYLYYKHEILGTDQSFNLDAGILYKPHSIVYLSLSGNNIIPVPGESGEVPLNLSLGFGIAPVYFLFLAFDPALYIQDGEKGIFNFGSGAQFFILDQFFLRFGFNRDIHQENHLSGGIGYSMNRIILNYSIRYSIEEGLSIEDRFYHALSAGINL